MNADQSKILLVDDLKDNLLALEGLLRRDDVEIFQAKSGMEALEFMIHHDFSLALIDVQMPGMSGFELAELMRGTKKTKNIPIIFVTATAKDRSFSFKGYESGAVDFLLKPLDTHAVKNKANIFIELDRQKRELKSQLATITRNQEEQAELLTILKKTQGELKKAVQIRNEFLATLSHELRTPLTAILSWAQMLLAETLSPEKIKRGIEIVEQSAKAQGQLIDDLLDISRIQAGKLNLTIQEIDPAKVISAAIDSTRSLATGKSISIETEVDPSIQHIFADPTRFQQILWNLITNSIKFSPKGGRIWVTLDRVASLSGRRIRLRVRDNGRGIKPEFIPVIFERFTQADSSTTRVYGGLGLGLAIVQKLVGMHEGSIEVESPGEDQGTTFTISFPEKLRVQIDATETEMHSRMESDAEVGIVLRGLKILVVEDDESTREIFSIILQSFGAELKIAESASEALSILGEFHPDVLVSDISMPVEDGYSLIGKVRALESKDAQTPALALTAYAGVEDVKRVQEAGFQSHMAKPVDARKLALAIARLARGPRSTGS